MSVKNDYGYTHKEMMIMCEASADVGEESCYCGHHKKMVPWGTCRNCYAARIRRLRNG